MIALSAMFFRLTSRSRSRSDKRQIRTIAFEDIDTLTGIHKLSDQTLVPAAPRRRACGSPVAKETVQETGKQAAHKFRQFLDGVRKVKDG